MPASASPPLPQSDPSPIREALSALGVRRLVLAIQDQSFPSTPDEDVGRGSPYGKGARDLLAFVAGQGFNGVQLGPQGETSLENPSPYDGALFTKSKLSIALATLAEEPGWALVCAGLLEAAVAGREQRAREERGSDGSIYRSPDRCQYRYAWQAAERTLRELHRRFDAARGDHGELAERFASFQRVRRAHLEADGLFEALVEEHGTDDWRRWQRVADGDAAGADLDQHLFCPPAQWRAAALQRRARLSVDGAAAVERHAFGQFALYEQHRTLRKALASGSAPLVLYGDLPVGFSHRDLWSRRALFRHDYLMGAPPSRTNPAGQPWGFPVFDPEQYFKDAEVRAPGAVIDLVVARVDDMLGDFDGLRIDHPHGLVCPWVYAADAADPAVAVGRGARLFCSPHVSDHPALAALAIPGAEQLSGDPGIARYADDWVRTLRDDQVARYGVLFDTIMTRVSAAGRDRSDVVCEVLSTWPYPLRRVMDRHGLGRFCVLQKADLTRPDDVYRAENASERDWIMVGNHDTRPIWLLADTWHGTAAGAQWAAYLADLLMPSPVTRARFARWVAADARHLCQAMFAALFASRAGQVSVFFADLFGLRESYNRPGIVDDDNWTLRLPSHWRARHQERLKQLDALNLPLALTIALASRTGEANGALINALMTEARRQTPALDGEITALIVIAASQS